MMMATRVGPKGVGMKGWVAFKKMKEMEAG